MVTNYYHGDVAQHTPREADFDLLHEFPVWIIQYKYGTHDPHNDVLRGRRREAVRRDDIEAGGKNSVSRQSLHVGTNAAGLVMKCSRRNDHFGAVCRSPRLRHF